MNPYQVIKDFESALSEYTGAPYVVCVNSCTAALELALLWVKKETKQTGNIRLPSKTYPSVAMAVKKSGYSINFYDYQWKGKYALEPWNIYDCACRFTSNMYEYTKAVYEYQCISFASNKILGIEQGGAILHNNPEADKWFRKMRYDGRTEGVNMKDDNYDVIGLHCPMLPSIAAQGLLRMAHIPKDNPDLDFYDRYPDLSQFEIFK